jgi:hypothetical protein
MAESREGDEDRAGRRWLAGSGSACPAASYRMTWPVVAPDPALAFVRGTAADICAVPCEWRLAAATITAASSATSAYSRLIAWPLPSQRPMRLVLGYGYARPAGLKVRRESTAIWMA